MKVRVKKCPTCGVVHRFVAADPTLPLLAEFKDKDGITRINIGVYESYPTRNVFHKKAKRKHARNIHRHR